MGLSRLSVPFVHSREPSRGCSEREQCFSFDRLLGYASRGFANVSCAGRVSSSTYPALLFNLGSGEFILAQQLASESGSCTSFAKRKTVVQRWR